MTELFGVPVGVDEDQVQPLLIAWSDGTRRPPGDDPETRTETFALLGYVYRRTEPTMVKMYVSEEFMRELREVYGV